MLGLPPASSGLAASCTGTAVPSTARNVRRRCTGARLGIRQQRVQRLLLGWATKAVSL